MVRVWRAVLLAQELLLKRECAEFLVLNNWQHWCLSAGTISILRSAFFQIAIAIGSRNVRGRALSARVPSIRGQGDCDETAMHHFSGSL